MVTIGSKTKGVIAFRALFFLAVCMALILFGMTKTNLQTVDPEGRNQAMRCDNQSRTITFSNFVTVHAWLERIRGEAEGTQFNITTGLTIGEPFTLTYRCSRLAS